MKTNITLIKSLTLFMALFCAVNFGFGQILTFDFDTYLGNEISANSNSNDPNLGVSIITRGSGLTRSINENRFNAVNWAGTSITDAITGSNYMQFTISPNSGYQFDISTIVVNFQRSNTGPNTIALRSSLDGYTASIDGEKTITVAVATTQIVTFTLNQSTEATAITYRIYGWATDNSGTGGFEGAGNDIVVNGSVSALPPCGAPITWDGSVWSNGTGPDISIPVVINADYDTATFGSFSACSLTVETGFTLSISDIDNGAPDNNHIEIANNLIVNGTILMNAKANFVQLDDAGTVTGTGTCEVEKNTAPMNAWYEYTYYSSPVTGAQIATALNESEPSRRYVFNAKNYLDVFKETANNNTFIAGQDDIDDNGDDWQKINGTTVMEKGVGYAATLTEFAYNISPGVSNKQFKSTFTGLFNFGVVTVPIYRNDSNMSDKNWNLIGNPYPSAIDADLFLAANSNINNSVTTPYTIDGAIFLWSQSTSPSGTANGTQGLNFSDADYAIINGVGETAGGDLVAPTNRKIPSGQAFFVSMSDSAPASSVAVPGYSNVLTANVIFNNSMRVRGATSNSLFFKNSNTKSKTPDVINKLWLDLTSDNGVFNQTLVGYLNGASNNDDGSYFDAEKNVSSATSAILYTSIEGSNKKFAIQGKATNSLNENEIIKLGFKTTITVPTLYKLSVAKLEGAFLTSNTVFLVDTLLNKVHNLSASDYTFTSSVGEFNSRFSIAFTNKALSVNEALLNTNALKIVELQDDFVQFNTSNNLTIKAVNIYDLLGRQLYQFTGTSTSETYKLSHLNNSIYIAKVALSNGAVVTKKAVKK